MRDEIERMIDEMSTAHELALRHMPSRDPLISLLAAHLRAALTELDNIDPDEWPDEAWDEIEKLRDEIQKERTSDMSTDPEVLKALAQIGSALARIADTLEKASVPTVTEEKPAPKAAKVEKSKAEEAVEATFKEAEDEAPVITLDTIRDAIMDLAEKTNRDVALGIVVEFTGGKKTVKAIPEDKYGEVLAAVEKAAA